MLPPAADAAAWRILRFSAIIHLQPFGTPPDTTLSVSVVQSRSTNSVNREAAATERAKPNVLVETRGGWLGTKRAAFLAAVQAATVEALRIPPRSLVLRLVEHPMECFVIPD